MSGEKRNITASDDEEKRKQAEENFNQFMEECFDEGWSQALCPAGCVVEPDGVCPHDFKSIALELGLI